MIFSFEYLGRLFTCHAVRTELLSPERKGYKDVFTIPQGSSVEVGGVSSDQVLNLAATIGLTDGTT